MGTHDSATFKHPFEVSNNTTRASVHPDVAVAENNIYVIWRDKILGIMKSYSLDLHLIILLIFANQLI